MSTTLADLSTAFLQAGSFFKTDGFRYAVLPNTPEVRRAIVTHDLQEQGSDLSAYRQGEHIEVGFTFARLQEMAAGGPESPLALIAKHVLDKTEHLPFRVFGS